MSSECPECKSKKLIEHYETHETICGECGYVIGHDQLDRVNPEKRVYDDEQRKKRTRTGAPETHTIHDKGLSTVIDWKDRDYYGKPLNPKQKNQMYRLRKWNKRIRIKDATERNLAYALSLISNASSRLVVPKIIHEEASVIYQKAVNEKFVRGRSIRSVAAASMRLALRQHEIPKTMEDVAEAFGVNKKEVARSYRHLYNNLDFYKTINPPNTTNYVSKFCNQLKCTGNTEGIANKIIKAGRSDKSAKKHGANLIGGRGPSGIAAAAVYVGAVLAGERRTQNDIAEAAGVTEVTIRNRYKELIKKLQFDIYL